MDRDQPLKEERLKEDARHGTVSFSMALYEWEESWHFQVPTHWHDEMELICLKEGELSIRVNGRSYVLYAPALVCIHPGEMHSLKLDEHCVESAVVFRPDMLSFEHYDAVQAKLIGPLVDGRLKLPLLLTGEDPVCSPAIACYETIEANMKQIRTCAVSYVRIKAALLELLALLYENQYLTYTSEIKSGEEMHLENLKKVIRYMNENYGSPIRLEELAKRANLNPQYFCRYFKRNMGKTVMEYMNEIRIEKAARALLETDDRIIDIAQNVGFEHVGYFIRRFRMEKGVTPSEYRKSQYSAKNSQ